VSVIQVDIERGGSTSKRIAPAPWHLGVPACDPQQQ